MIQGMWDPFERGHEQNKSPIANSCMAMAFTTQQPSRTPCTTTPTHELIVQNLDSINNMVIL